MASDQQSNAAASSSRHNLATDAPVRSNSIPSLPSPDIGGSSLLDEILGPSPLRNEIKTVQELESENSALDAKIRELQARLDAAEAKAKQASSGNEHQQVAPATKAS